MTKEYHTDITIYVRGTDWRGKPCTEKFIFNNLGSFETHPVHGFYESIQLFWKAVDIMERFLLNGAERFIKPGIFRSSIVNGSKKIYNPEFYTVTEPATANGFTCLAHGKFERNTETPYKIHPDFAKMFLRMMQ